MADPNLGAMTAIIRIRKAQCEAARAEVFSAEAGLSRVRDAEHRSRTDRDVAHDGWRALLDGGCPDLALLRLAGDWLIEREKGFHAARIDTGIARGELDAATDVHGRSLARLDASHQIGERLRRDVIRKRDARVVAEAADGFLRRRP